MFGLAYDDTNDFPVGIAKVTVLPEIIDQRQKHAQESITIDDIVSGGRIKMRDPTVKTDLVEITLTFNQDTVCFAFKWAGSEVVEKRVSLLGLKKAIQGYIKSSEIYEEAIRHAPQEKIKAMDEARKTLHLECANRLQQRLGEDVVLGPKAGCYFITLLANRLGNRLG